MTLVFDEDGVEGISATSSCSYPVFVLMVMSQARDVKSHDYRDKVRPRLRLRLTSTSQPRLAT
jgi:hypothetical protein